MFDLAGKVAIVTGAASGIGLTTARRFVAAGATVVMSDVTDASDVATDLGGAFVEADVTDQAAVALLVATTLETRGRLDVLVNNAGVVGPGAGLLGDPMDDSRAVLEINLLGAMNVLKAAAKVMERGSTIVNTASMAGLTAFPGLSAYGVTKWGMVGLTQYAAIELGPRGIRVNCVCPSGVSTPMAGPSSAWQVSAQQLGNQHDDRLVEPEEVAAAIHFLASDEAAMINGHALAIDGGLAAGLSVQLIEAAVGRSILDGDGTVADS